MDLLAQGHAWLDRQRRAYASQDVRYARGADVLASVPATIGRTLFDLTDADGVVTRAESRDFIITAADLILPTAGSIEPKVGDKITEGGFVYEVLPFGNEPHWRWGDPARVSLRIHTKQIGTT